MGERRDGGSGRVRVETVRGDRRPGPGGGSETVVWCDVFAGMVWVKPDGAEGGHGGRETESRKVASVGRQPTPPLESFVTSISTCKFFSGSGDLGSSYLSGCSGHEFVLICDTALRTAKVRWAAGKSRRNVDLNRREGGRSLWLRKPTTTLELYGNAKFASSRQKMNLCRQPCLKIYSH